MTALAPAERHMPSRPTRVAVAGIVLTAVAILATALMFLGPLIYLGTQYEGVARPSPIEQATGALVRALIPASVALTSAAAAWGILRGRSWGGLLAIVWSLVFLLAGVALVFAAAREWGMEGSFAPLYLPPAVCALLVGSFVGFAVVTSRPYFQHRSSGHSPGM